MFILSHQNPFSLLNYLLFFFHSIFCIIRDNSLSYCVFLNEETISITHLCEIRCEEVNWFIIMFFDSQIKIIVKAFEYEGLSCHQGLVMTEQLYLFIIK